MSTFDSKKLMAVALASAILFSISIANAKPVNLYDGTKSDAKVIGTIESTSPVIPIFTTKEGDWMKIGDPKDGNVGWAKVNELESNSKEQSASGFSFSQHTVNTPTGPKTYNTIQFGMPDAVQTKAMIKNIQLHQGEVQKSIQKLMKDFYMDMNSLYLPSEPLFMPILAVPAQDIKPVTAPNPADTTKPPVKKP